MEYNYTHVFVYFLPGAAGNFLSRCLNLLDSFHCYVDPAHKVLPATITEKMALLNYESMENLDFSKRNWRNFERSILHFSQFKKGTDLSAPRVWSQTPPSVKNQTFIWAQHPPVSTDLNTNLRNTSSVINSLATAVDGRPRIVKFYIDPGSAWEWHLINALYKNSFIGGEYLLEGKRLLEDPALIKVNLSNFIHGSDIFLTEFIKICRVLGHTVSDQEQQYVQNLHQQWLNTIVPLHRIEEFKKFLGFPQT